MAIVQGRRELRVPHVGGDEPWMPDLQALGDCAFPTSVGMNRFASVSDRQTSGVPHVGGDEPLVMASPEAVEARSPRRWG